MHTRHQRGTPQTQHLSFGLRLMSKPESQVVEDIKTGEEEQEDQNYQSSSKAPGAEPRCVSPFLPLTLPLSSDATWSLAQVTALFNDAICLMPSCGCQSISHYPSSCLSCRITRTPWLRHTKEQRASPGTSLQWPIRSILQTNWWETWKTRRKQQQATTKTGGEGGRWWAHLLSSTSPFCWSGRFHRGTNWDEGGSQRGKSVQP